MDKHHFQPLSPSPCQNHEECSCNTRMIRVDRELRCLFVREWWSEYFRWLWRHPCSRMPMKKDTHRWDWACLSIIHSGWESLSRMMWRGYLNVSLVKSILFLVLSDMSLGKSSQSIHIHFITSHYQCVWSIIAIEIECIVSHLNGSQFRQVYSITHITINHSQTQHENTQRMHFYQIRVIWEKACLVITLCEWEHSSTPMKQNRNCDSQ